MKIRVTLKDPDGVEDCIRDEIMGEVRLLPISEREKDAICDFRRKIEGEKLCRWIKYGEYVTVEFDTEAMTARVVEVE